MNKQERINEIRQKAQGRKGVYEEILSLIEMGDKTVSDLKWILVGKIEAAEGVLTTLELLGEEEPTEVDDNRDAVSELDVDKELEPRSIKTKLYIGRKRRGWTQMQMGERLGVTGTTVGNWERGKFPVNMAYIGKIEELYQTAIQECNVTGWRGSI